MKPFVTDFAQSVSSLGESELIDRIQSWLGSSNPPEPAGIGDDCAVFTPSSPGAQQLITTDPVIYGKHFDNSLSPEETARKLANRNLSDLAAMGGRPEIAIVSLAMDPDVSVEWIKRFYQALAANALSNSYKIVGGDVSSADSFLGAFFTLVGETQSGVTPLTRRSSRVGDHIYVTGTLGGSRLSKHHSFTPRLTEGQWLANSGACRSCTDLSDGLGKDLTNILHPTLGCEIDSQAIPISKDAKITAARSGQSFLHHAFNDGEDYELLFAIDPEADQGAFAAAWKERFETQLTCIGRVTPLASSNGSRVKMLGARESLVSTGYEHLR